MSPLSFLSIRICSSRSLIFYSNWAFSLECLTSASSFSYLALERSRSRSAMRLFKREISWSRDVISPCKDPFVLVRRSLSLSISFWSLVLSSCNSFSLSLKSCSSFLIYSSAWLNFILVSASWLASAPAYSPEELFKSNNLLISLSRSLIFESLWLIVWSLSPITPSCSLIFLLSWFIWSSMRLILPSRISI